MVTRLLQPGKRWECLALQTELVLDKMRNSLANDPDE